MDPEARPVRPRIAQPTRPWSGMKRTDEGFVAASYVKQRDGKSTSGLMESRKYNAAQESEQ